jgi:serine/threonine-protein kinase
MPDIPSRLGTALAERYAIERQLGEGGMATVYLATDLKHERPVALKVLKPELAAVLGADRFVQEIKTTASLQHPNILPLFDSGEADGFLYYVMPYIEGETLRDLLDREAQLGIDEAVKLTVDVADALHAAHEQGVIHRDIKPENILLHNGRPMVADFGIALAVSAAAGGRMTETGLSLGTPHYMSPEQATGAKNITARSDVYSLASVLYEMLTGSPPHSGATAQQIIMQIVADEARPVTDLRHSVPAHVAAAVTKALQKLPADRFGSAADFSAALQNPGFAVTGMATATAGRAGGPTVPRSTAAALVGALVVLSVVAAWGWLRPTNAGQGVGAVEFYLDPPDSTMVLYWVLPSPDGQRLVSFVGTEVGTQLYQRALDERDWRPIPGTEGARLPFFSPDGAWLGFFSDMEGALKRVPTTGGAPQTIAVSRSGSVQVDLRTVGSVSWGSNDTLVLAAADPELGWSTLFQVAAAGGPVERLTQPGDSMRLHLEPSHVPGTDLVLFTEVMPGTTPPPDLQLAALSLESGEITRLGPGLSPVSDGRGTIVYATPDGIVVSQDFNERTLSLEGARRHLVENVQLGNFGSVALYGISPTGTLVYLEGSGAEELMLVSREGRGRTLVSAPRIVHPRYSPTGDRIAYVRSDAGDTGDLWVYTMADGTAQRLSFDRPVADPAWSWDGRTLGFSVVGSGDTLAAALYRRPADGTGRVERVVAGEDNFWQMAFVPGDREIVFRRQRTGSAGPDAGDLWRYALDGASEAVPLFETPALEEHGALSPDGRWIAYTSDETGTVEVYVRSYPDMGSRTLVSVGGGSWPMWSADGAELLYFGQGQSWLMAATLTDDGERVTVADRRRLFRSGGFRRQANRNYDVHPGGQEFVMVGGTTARVVARIGALDTSP